MYCKWCGSFIDDDCIVCPKCGKQVQELKQTIEYITPIMNNKVDDDIPNGGITILSFLFPLIGLIIYCCNISTKPKYAKEAGAAALAGFFVGIFILPLVSCSLLFI